MKRIDAEGATELSRFTDGDPATQVPATVVDASWLNHVQEEISAVIEDRGLALDEEDEGQLLKAIKALVRGGGDQINVSVANNQGSPANVTGLSFDKTGVKAVRLLFNIHRRTDSSAVDETGELFLFHNSESDEWGHTLTSHGDDAGVTFSVSSGGQVQYSSSNMAGASYAGTLRVTAITALKQ